MSILNLLWRVRAVFTTNIDQILAGALQSDIRVLINYLIQKKQKKSFFVNNHILGGC